MNRDRISKEIEETYAKEPKTFAMKLGIAFIILLLLAWSSSTMERIPRICPSIRLRRWIRSLYSFSFLCFLLEQFLHSLAQSIKTSVPAPGRLYLPLV